MNNANENAQELRADVSAQRLAKVYAEALLNAADKKGQADEVIGELDALLDDVFKGEPKLEVLFSGAAVGRKAREVALKKAFEGRASDAFFNFLLVVNDHERLELLRPIRKALHDLNDERHRRLHVHVHSAVAVPDDVKECIARTVRQRFELEPVLIMHVDPALLGGMKIRIGDRQFDATVRARLEDLRNQIIARSSHEIQSRRDRYSSAG